MTTSCDSLRQILAQGLCHRCGSCAGICPKRIIRPDGDYYPAWEDREGECADCGLCVRVCPGASFSFPEYSRRVFGRDRADDGEHGFFLKAFLGYASDAGVRERATSGGIGTALPRWLIETGRVRGAFSVVSDEAHPWKPKAIIARTEDRILEAALSKYPACSVNHLFGEARSDEGPFVFTGLPCHLHGLRKMAALDKRIEAKIALAIGLVCHSCLDHQALRDIFSAYGIEEGDIARIEYRGGKLPGYIRALTREGGWLYLPYPHLGPERYRPNAKECLTLFFKFHSPPRCRLCIDAMAEYSDISIGDPWVRGWEARGNLRRGYNLVLARTERGLKSLEEAEKAGAIRLEPFQNGAVSASHQPMVHRKKMRGFHSMERRKGKNAPRPDYGFEKALTPGERLSESVRAATYFAADRPRIRRVLFHALISPPARLFVGALFFRRRVLRALVEKAKKGIAAKKDI